MDRPKWTSSVNARPNSSPATSPLMNVLRIWHLCCCRSSISVISRAVIGFDSILYRSCLNLIEFVVRHRSSSEVQPNDFPFLSYIQQPNYDWLNLTELLVASLNLLLNRDQDYLQLKLMHWVKALASWTTDCELLNCLVSANEDTEVVVVHTSSTSTSWTRHGALGHCRL